MSEQSRGNRHEGEVDSTDDKSGDVITATSGVGTTPGLHGLDLSPASMHRASQLIGKVISGRYKIVAPIATGGMGTVFRGDHLHMRKRLAIKILHAETEGLPELVAQFQREAIAGAHVTHPNVATATDFGELDDGSYFLILEYVHGVTLTEVLKNGPLEMTRALHVARQVAAALQAVHAIGIVHRDVKPSNVMLLHGPGDQAKLIDFGFAKVPVEQISHEGGADRPSLAKTISDPDTVFGTIGYLAPEAAAGMDAVDGRSDLYALGAIMYEMLTGKRPFEAKKNSELFQMHRMQPPPLFRDRAPDVAIPQPIEAVVLQLLAKSPAKRFQSGAEVVAAIDKAIKASAPAPTPRYNMEEIEKAAQVAPPSRVKPLLVLLLLTLCFAGGVYWFRWHKSETETEPAASSSSEPGVSPTEVDGLGAAAWTAKLLAANRDFDGGAKALAALAKLDPTALRDAEVAKAATAVAIDATRTPQRSATADQVFDLLATRFGSEGLDILYDMVETRKTPDSAKRAEALLRQEKILEKASPALRIAVELREAPCEKKRDLFNRAAGEGDKRALTVLNALRSAPCKGPKDPCCHATSKFLTQTIASLKARVKK